MNSMDLGAGGSAQFQKRGYAYPITSSGRSDLSQWMVSKGIAKDTTRADYILLGLVITIVILTIILFVSNSSSNESLTPQQIQDIANHQYDSLPGNQ